MKGFLIALASLTLVAADRPPAKRPFVGPIRASRVEFIAEPGYRPKVGDVAYLMVYLPSLDILYGGAFSASLNIYQEYFRRLASHDSEGCTKMEGDSILLLEPGCRVKIQKLGEDGDFTATRVRVAISGKLYEGWVNRGCLAMPKVNPDYRRHLFAEPKTAVAKPSTRDEALVLTDLNLEIAGERVTVEGRVKNVSAETVDVYRVTITYEDASGRLVSTSDTILLPTSIPPGSFTTFKKTDKSKPAIDHVKIDLSGDAGKPFPWTDRSGKNAHP